MQKRSVYISAGLHAAIVIMATISWPWLKRDYVIPQPMMVEMVDIAEIVQTDKPAPTPVPKQEEKPEPKVDEPPPAPKAATNKEQAPATPKKKSDKKKSEDKEEKKVAEKLDKKKEPDKKKEKKAEEKKEASKDFSSVLKNLTEDDEKVAPKTPAPNLNTDAQATEGANAPMGEKMTMREEDALRAQLEKCWNVPYGAKDAENMIVEIFMVISPDRTLREARVVDTARYNRDSFYRAMADSAMRAVRNPLCSPFELPADKYNVWKTTTVTFNPSQMF